MHHGNVLHTVAEWDEWRQHAAADRERVVFKFSPICSVSSRAERQFDRWVRELPPQQSVSWAKIDVIGARPLSQHVARVLAVPHHSPQVIWLDIRGGVKWHASHFDIDVEALNAQLSSQPSQEKNA